MTCSLDIESASTQPNAVILSIGVVQFSTKNGKVKDTFYRTIAADSQMDRHTCADTLAWWSKQNAAVREEAFSGTESLTEVLLALSAWMKPYSHEKIYCRGYSFDLGILGDAYKSLQLPVPWKYYNQMELRTLEYVASRLGIPMAPKAPEGQLHNALSDAEYQAQQCFFYHEELGINKR